jgi:prepilin-type N-terminal cleavage/methylation domain-containing protein
MTARNRRGMTLIELVIGLAITGIMAAAGVAAFGAIIDHRQIIRDASASTERAAALRETIRSWVVNGTPRIQLGGGPRGLTRGAASGSAAANTLGGMNAAAVTPAQATGDDFTVTTSAITPAMTPNLTIRLYIDGDANTPEKGLTIEYQPTPQSPLLRRMLDSTIDTLRVEYLDGRTHRWFAASQAATLTSMTAIRLTLIPNPASPPSPLITLPMVFGVANAATAQGGR